MKAAIALCALASLAAAQTQPAFEVASFKVAAPLTPENRQGRFRGIKIDGSIAQYGGMSLLILMTRAFRVASYQVIGPDWMTKVNYDIRAKLPDGATEELVPEMLQSLLAERLKLKCHYETRELSVNVLGIAKDGPKITRIPDTFDKTKFVSTSIGVVVSLLSQSMDRPAIDETNLSGDFLVPTERMTAARLAMMRALIRVPDREATPQGDGLFELLKSLGLKIEPRKMPIKMVVIDQAEQTPTEN